MNFLRKLLAPFLKLSNSANVSQVGTPYKDSKQAYFGHDGMHEILVGTGQSTGIERSHNEDALLVLTGRSAGETPLPEFGLFVVADGMGGHRAGEVASAVSVRTVARKLTEGAILQIFDTGDDKESAPLQELLRED